MMVLFGTGHRPDKCGGYDAATFGYLVATARLMLMWCDPQEVLTGMALGWDMALAQASYELGIPYTPCIPFKGQETMWRPEQQALYHTLINLAPRPAVYVCDPPYAAAKMEIRNRYMVDNGTQGLSLWNGDPKGGTANCVRYAASRGVVVENAWQRFHDFRKGVTDVRPWQSRTYPAVSV